MRLLNITARAHAAGNRIDLAWTNPDPVRFPGVRVLRREGTHPLTPTDGVIVADGVGLLSASDAGLKGETAYYYTLFPFKGAPAQFEGDPHNRVSAVATTPYDFAERMYGLLPALYRRFDEAQGPTSDTRIEAADRAKGQLRRFLDLPGAQFDQIYSSARSALNLYDVDRVEGSLLPLLAQWIDWRTDFTLEVRAQRNELRFAPQIYQAIGLIPAVEATVKRITDSGGAANGGWESRTKEFVHNVARTNQPPRLNMWSMLRPSGGTFTAAALASLNFNYDGCATAVNESDGSLSFFYHTYRSHGWDIWTKRFAGGVWQPSAPVVDRSGTDKQPAAALQGAVLWLFWESCDPTQPMNDRTWQINFQTRAAGVWTAPAVFGDAVTPRRMPTATVDDAGGLWLFWLELTANGWTVKYNRHDGVKWLAAPIDFPLDGGLDPRVESGLFIMFQPAAAAPKRLWLFWARHETGGPPGQSRWTIAYRIKQALDPAVIDWSRVSLLPKTAAGDHDREPAPLVSSTGNIELFWSSTRAGGWTLWHNTVDISALTWGVSQQLTNTPYANRAPLAVNTGSGTLLAFRSNESLAYTSSVYGATQTLDARYAGTATADTRNAAQIAMRGSFEDFQTYTADTGQNGLRTNDDRIARDTIGLFLKPDIADPVQIAALVSRLANVLAEFMPITDRAVFITP